MVSLQEVRWYLPVLVIVGHGNGACLRLQGAQLIAVVDVLGMVGHMLHLRVIIGVNTSKALSSGIILDLRQASSQGCLPKGASGGSIVRTS